ncbi:AAA domain-containing protein [Anaerosinus gibii]|uniref:AAA domain-containing protein n=1 Tax=Selenobaculum gibii TaxID=3054208 RepID=A0A9Y2EQQ3_9FIRM|nr:AAA domain-containing protein [Selenobaculum gbiensis]WIW70277.1 AAA domain-containing protein [Selenobaculum gbiensis]
MNIEKHLILIDDEDKTESISHCAYENGKWQINFGKDKTYFYHYSKVKCFKEPDLRYPTTTDVYYNDQPLSGIEKILVFEQHIRICFASGYKKIYKSQEIRFEESCLNNPNASKRFEYLKQLAEIVSISSDENSSFLSNQYKKISKVNSNSVLAKYLNPTILNSQLNGYLPIFPFGFNLSQKDATEKALANPISVIEGPPGTGKTQTILNIIANAIINEKTVAIVSNNNAATANVLEKLEKYGVDFIAAYLGKNENKKEFFANQAKIYPDMSSWVINEQDYDIIRKSIETSGKQLEDMLKIKNTNAILKQELAALKVEKEYFDKYYNEASKSILAYKSLYKHSSNIVMNLWLEYQLMMETCTDITLIYKLKNLFRYGIISFSFYKNSNEEMIAFFQKLYYDLKEKELNEQIKRLTERLENYQFDVAIKKYSEESMKLFKATLVKRFSKNKERETFTADALWKNIDSFNREYPIILSTTHSLRSCISPDYLFDYVIMDEASQVDIVAGSLALSCARNAVIVGDLKQLPNVVSNSISKESNRIFEKYQLNKAYHYADNSMLSSITGLFNDVPRSLLKEHYRCHPQIIGFCNQKFYNNELIILTEDDGRKNPLVAYKTVKGNHARGNYNQRQIDVILQEVLPYQTDNDPKQTVGVISPYRLQTDKVKESIGTRNIEVDTIHKYQGREKDVVILTTVVNEINSFVDNPNLINVAVSRAVDKLVVIISEGEKKAGSNIGDLVRYIEYNNFEIINSSIYSVFDLLYHDYSDRLLALMKKKKNVSHYESENLMYIVIEKVLNLPEFNYLDCVLHQPLKMLIRNSEKLDPSEYSFTMNVLTHTDFLIFNKSDKSPVLAVEVDGYEFHANNPKQLERDKLKDTILKKYDIPILRIKTNESGEEAKLYDKLIQSLKAKEQSLDS